MHTHDLTQWEHEHTFRQDRKKTGEARTLTVVLISGVMMVVEITTGVVSGSMALLADGLHMASHTTALGIGFCAYSFARRRAADRRSTFGTGKVGSLAGFASAVMLLGFSLVMVIESTERFINPVTIAFNQALVVAAIGLFVNGACAWILMGAPGEGAEHHHSHDHHHHDHNLKAAYLHVLADALTSIFAIVALVLGKYANASWLDPVMGIVGAALVARWSFGLIRDSSMVLLDRQVGDGADTRLRRAIEQRPGDRVTDLHIWRIGQGLSAAEIVLVSDDPESPDYYKSLIHPDLHVVHAIVEVHRYPRA